MVKGTNESRRFANRPRYRKERGKIRTGDRPVAPTSLLQITQQEHGPRKADLPIGEIDWSEALYGNRGEIVWINGNTVLFNPSFLSFLRKRKENEKRLPIN